MRWTVSLQDHPQQSCRCGVAEFTADQVATWLEEANCFGRARWVHRPDAAKLAADLSGLDFTDRFIPHNQVTRQVGQITDTMRRLAAAWDDPALANLARDTLIDGVGAAFYLDTADLDDGHLAAQQVKELITNPNLSESVIKQWLDQRVAERMAYAQAWRALKEDPGQFSRKLRRAADESDRQLASGPSGYTHAGQFSFLYERVGATLEKHTGTKVSIRADGPDARFVCKVIEHAGLPWRPWVWRGIRTWEARSRSVRNRR
jgi:hypothetical protein